MGSRPPAPAQLYSTLGSHSTAPYSSYTTLAPGMDLFTVSGYPSYVVGSNSVLVSQTMASYQVRCGRVGEVHARLHGQSSAAHCTNTVESRMQPGASNTYKCFADACML